MDDDGPVVWDSFNRKHICEDHPERGMGVDDVEEALSDPRRLTSTERRADGVYYSVIGRTLGGRLLYVAFVSRPVGRYPSTPAKQVAKWLGGTRRMSNQGVKFGPDAHQLDPFDGMTDRELDDHLEEMLSRQEAANVTISIRMPAELLERAKRVASEAGVPYQTLIKRLVDSGLALLEERRRRAS